MAVTEATRAALYARAGGKCECTMQSCRNHLPGFRCGAPLLGGLLSAWHAHHINANGGDELSNLRAMCIPCHKNTPSYGVGAR